MKPENVLITKENKCDSIKLIDFGLAQKHSLADEPMRDAVGTPCCVAPRALEASHSREADVFSAGVIACLVLAGFVPFNGESMQEVMDAV